MKLFQKWLFDIILQIQLKYNLNKLYFLLVISKLKYYT